MTDFFEVDEKQKSVKILNLDDFSVEDLQNYVSELENEILRVQAEIKKKKNLKLNAEKFFKKWGGYPVKDKFGMICGIQ